MTTWECDGCTRVIDDHEVPKACPCKNHWGWMVVGGKAWMDFHNKGIHPMSDIVSAIKKRKGKN